jgi:carbamoyl-phosphate synthase large subunit
MKKIIVTGAGAVLGQGILKSLRAAKTSCEIVALDPSPLAVGLYWADRHMIIPMANDPSFPDAMRAILEAENADALLVGTDSELAVFADNRPHWERDFGTHILVSDKEVVEIADDKYATVQFLVKNGLSYPETALADDMPAIEELITKCGFPLIVKPRRGARSIGVSKVENRQALFLAIEGRSDLIVQQMAGDDDQEFTAGVLFFDDDVKALIVLRRDLRDGNTHRAYSGEFPECERYVYELAKALKPYGPANFQFRLDHAGTPRLFEINARFSGTTPMRMHFGLNEVDLCLRKLLLDEEIIQPPIRQGTVLRYLEEVFVASGDMKHSRMV